MVTLIMLVVAGVGIVALVQLTTQNVRDVNRSENRLQAFYVAEAGTQHVVDWFNRPDDSPDRDYFSPWPDGNFLDGQNQSVVQSVLEVEPDFLPAITAGSNGQLGGQVVALIVEPPWVDDPPATVARVTSVGRSPRGIESTVEIRLMDNRVPSITSPAAILSREGASSSGQFQVNWGEIWTRDNLDLPHPLNQKFPNSRDDPWFGARSEANLVRATGNNTNYADGRERGGYSNSPIEQGAANYYQPFLESTLDRRNNQLRDYENLYQNQENLAWPDYDYDTMKTLAQYHGFPIYRTTAGGDLITGHDGAGNPIVRSFDEVFDRRTHDGPDDVVPDDAPPLYFIDTIDGNPPRADGANLATIRVQGGGPFFHGNFFIGANIRFGGAGNSPTLNNPRKPDGSLGQAIRSTRLYGMFYTYGQSEFQGQGDIYGSVYAERGFGGGGNWEIFYDHRMQDETRTRVGSRLRTQLWNTF